MLKAEIHWRCTVVSLRNNLECWPDVAAARQNSPQATRRPQQRPEKMVSIPPAFCLVCLYCILLTEKSNQLFAVDVAKYSLSAG